MSDLTSDGIDPASLDHCVSISISKGAAKAQAGSRHREMVYVTFIGSAVVYLAHQGTFI